MLHVAKNHGGNLGGTIDFVLHLDRNTAVCAFDNFERADADRLLDFGILEFATDQTLYRIQRSGRIGHCLSLGDLSNKPLVIIGKSHHGRSGSISFKIGDDFRLTALHHRHT